MKKFVSVILHGLVYLVVFVLTSVITIMVYNARLGNEINAPLKCEWNDSIGKKIENLRYSQGDFGEYDLYLPIDKNAHALILFIHGGGFTGGDKNDEDTWCKFFTSKGYITASPNYSIADGKHQANINIMFDELRKCVASIKTECEKYGYHIDGMATSGQSAGGCLALLYAFKDPSSSAIPVKFVFQQTGPVNFEPDGWGNNDNESRKNFVAMMTGKTITYDMIKSGKYHNLVNEISPVAFVDSASVPSINAYGPKDKVVPVNIKNSYLDKISMYPDKHIYIEYPNSGHGLLDDPDKQELFVNEALNYCHQYFDN